ncbi:MAG: hypothetical protein A3K77_00390 [Euryarchaeota archaeon RBG_13_31_8]|nr:MAG: hypothetical protein A3K77_00390 [Euryarchaeota archaeon RBG_13_31_8]
MKYKILRIVNSVLLIFFVLVILLIINISAITVNTDAEFIVENKTYTVTHTMSFHIIIINDSYIIFNNTGFFISSGNTITVPLVYINSNIGGDSWIREDVDNNRVIEVLDLVLSSNHYGTYWW